MSTSRIAHPALESPAGLYERGRALGNEGHHAEAAAVFRQALQALDAEAAADPDLVALRVHVRSWLGIVTFATEGLAAALEHLDAAAADAARQGDPTLVASCHNRRANVFGRAGRIEDALRELDHVMASLELFEPLVRCAALINRGTARSFLGMLDEADDDLAAAAREAADAQLPDQVAIATHNRGWVAYLRGDLPAALRHYADARRHHPFVNTIRHIDGARVLLEAGLLAEAERLLSDAVDSAASLGDALGEAEARHGRAVVALLRGRPTPARTDVDSARATFSHHEATSWVSRCDLLLAQIALATGAWNEAAGIAESALGTLSAHPLQEHRGRLLAAEASLAGGDREAADRHLAAADDVLGDRRSLAPLSQRLHRSRLAAATSSARGDTDGARRHLEAAAGVLGDACVATASIDFRTARTLHARQLAALDLSLSTGSPADMLLSVERWRAIGGRAAPVRAHHPPELRATLAELRRRRRALRDGPPSEEEQRRLQELQEQATQLARQAEQHDRSGSPATSRPTREGLDLALRAARATDADVVTFAQADGDLLGIGIVDGDVVAKSLGPAVEVLELARRTRLDVRMAASVAPGPLRPAILASLDRSTSALRSVLLAPFGELGGARLVVVPGAVPASLPWPMLADPGKAVTVCTSAIGWAERALAPATSVERAMALAGPGLRRGAEECADVATAWEGAGAEGDATAEALREAFASADVLHVAAHGVHQPENPMFSSLLTTDGPFFLHDVEAGGRVPAHVVLSSCELGDAQARGGGEQLGLAVGLLSLGACSVVAAACDVPEDVAPAVMAAYHRSLASGVPSDLALAGALRDADPIARSFVTFGTHWSVEKGPTTA